VPESVTLEFVLAKTTKNTKMFEEKPAPGSPPVVGTIYVQKWWVGDAEKIKVTIQKEK
jgi:hypothetical protein